MRKNGHYCTVLKQTIREAEISANPNLEYNHTVVLLLLIWTDILF